MAEEPFDPIIQQLADLLKFAEKNAGKSLEGTADPEVDKRLDILEKTIENFSKLCNLQINAEGVTSQEMLMKFREDPEQFSPHQQKLMRDFINLGLNAVVLRAGFARAKRAAGQSKIREVSKNTRKSIQKRRNKFKGVGRDPKWKKL